MKTGCLLLLSAIILTWLASCSHDHADEPVPVDTSCTHNGTDTMHYMKDIVPITTTYCTDPTLGDCHSPSASSGLDYTNYDIFSFECDKTNNDGTISKVEDRVFGPFTTGAKMPNNGVTLASCDAAKLLLWIQQGFKNN